MQTSLQTENTHITLKELFESGRHVELKRKAKTVPALRSMVRTTTTAHPDTFKDLLIDKKLDGFKPCCYITDVEKFIKVFNNHIDSIHNELHWNETCTECFEVKMDCTNCTYNNIESLKGECKMKQYVGLFIERDLLPSYLKEVKLEHS